MKNLLKLKKTRIKKLWGTVTGCSLINVKSKRLSEFSCDRIYFRYKHRVWMRNLFYFILSFIQCELNYGIAMNMSLLFWEKYINYVTEIGIYSEETTKHLFLSDVTIKCTLVYYTLWACYIEFYTYELESEIAPMFGSL